MSDNVKRETGRRARKRSARATRSRILRAFQELVRDDGYADTTMAEVAARAGVAVQTVYFTFGTKGALLLAAFDDVTAGGVEAPPQEQDWYQVAQAEPDLKRSIEILVRQLRSVTAAMMPFYKAVLAAAAADAEVERAFAIREARWREDNRVVIRWLSTKRPLRVGLDVERAADLLRLIIGPVSYSALVLESRWTDDDWAAWASEAIELEVFGPPVRDA
jgi:AcrR family transcriptional regulator